MKPFSTPVLSKRTYRELKLLKHLRHENVCIGKLFPTRPMHLTRFHRSSVLATSSSLPSRTCAYLYSTTLQLVRLISLSYFVTELLGTDLHRLLTSRPLEKQFIQYFLYQILVRSTRQRDHRSRLIRFPARIEIRPLRRCCPP